MDENTKHIVASNLTIAFISHNSGINPNFLRSKLAAKLAEETPKNIESGSAQEKIDLGVKKEIQEIYLDFVNKLS